MFTIPDDVDLEVEDVAHHFRDSLNIIPASVDTGVGKTGELMQIGYTKGTGLSEVAEKLGFPIEHTISVGDALNDLELVQTAGLGIAMGNAVPEVKAAADWSPLRFTRTVLQPQWNTPDWLASTLQQALVSSL